MHIQEFTTLENRQRETKYTSGRGIYIDRQSGRYVDLAMIYERNERIGPKEQRCVMGSSQLQPGHDQENKDV